MTIYEKIIRDRVKQPVRLELELWRLVPDKTGNGNDARYFKAYINGSDVTKEVAEAINFKLSKSRNTMGCLIVHGSGTDMCFVIQSRMYSRAYVKGYPGMFDMNEYKYLGRKNSRWKTL